MAFSLVISIVYRPTRRYEQPYRIALRVFADVRKLCTCIHLLSFIPRCLETDVKKSVVLAGDEVITVTSS